MTPPLKYYVKHFAVLGGVCVGVDLCVAGIVIILSGWLK